MTTLKRIYSRATPAERDQLTLLMLQRIQAHQRTRERRILPSSIHWIGDRRKPAPTWWPFEPSTPSRTPHVIFASLIGMTAVIATALASASVNAAGLLMIPAYGIFLMIVLINRQYRLNLAT